MSKGHNQWGQTYMSLEPIGWTYNQSEQGNVCRKEGMNPVGSTANATFLSTKLRNAVVCSSFRDNLPSSLYNTVTIACSTNISGGHLCLPNTSVGSLYQTQPVLDKWLWLVQAGPGRLEAFLKGKGARPAAKANKTEVAHSSGSQAIFSWTKTYCVLLIAHMIRSHLLG